MNPPAFTPLPFFGGPHRQTFAGWVGEAPDPPLGVVVHRVPLGEGDATTVHFHEPPGTGSETPTLVLIHGLEGGAGRSYMIRTANKAAARGYRTARMNMRWCGDAEGLSARFYNSTQSGDVAAVCRFLRERYPEAPIGALGFSLGGNMVLKMAAEGIFPSLSCAVGICPSIDLEASSRKIVRPGNAYYLRQLVRSMVDRGNRFLARNGLDLEVPVAYGITIREFDTRFTVPLGGFESLEDYYRKGSSRDLLPKIRIPTLIIASHDDPLIPFESFKGVDGQVRLLATERGGHLGFVGKRIPGDPDRYWAENRAIEFFARGARV